MERAPTLIRAFPSFESEHYRALWIAAATSAVSMWSLIMARAWLALELADSGLAVGAVTFAAMAPWTLAPIAGALADRFDRASMIVIGRVLHLNFALILAYLAFSHSLEVWHLILLAFASGVAWAIENSAQNALLPNTVDKNSLLNAITLLSMANFGSRLVGPLIGAPLLAGLGAGWIFVMAACFYAVSILLTLRLRLRSTGGLGGSELSFFTEARRGLAEAFRYVGSNPQIRLVIAVVALHCLFTMSFDSMLPILAKREFGGGTGMFSALLMGIGGGALIGTLSLSFVRDASLRGRLFIATGIASGLTLAIAGLAPTRELAVLGVALSGGAQAMFVALGSAMIQSVVKDEIRGRVMSLYALFGDGVMAVMILSNGAATDVVNVRYLFWVPGLTFAVVLSAWALMHSELRHIATHGEIYLGRSRPEPETALAAGGGGG
jgi:MFS family permease